MNYIKLDNVFNYVPAPTRTMFGDDDQMLSWAFQGWKLLHDSRTAKVKDVAILDVVNHKATFPSDAKRILSVSVYNDNCVSDDTLASICDSIELPSNDSYASACSVHLKHFYDSDFYTNCWISVARARNHNADYLCKVDNISCNHLWTSKPGSNVATFDFLEGVIAVEYETVAKDDNDNLMLPEEPEVLWHFLGAFVKYKLWDYYMALGKEGAFRNKREYQTEMAVLKVDAKRAITHMGVSAFVHRHLVFDESRLMKMPSFNHRLTNWRSDIGGVNGII